MEEDNTVCESTSLEAYIYQIIAESAMVPLDSTLRRFVIQDISIQDLTLKVTTFCADGSKSYMAFILGP